MLLYNKAIFVLQPSFLTQGDYWHYWFPLEDERDREKIIQRRQRRKTNKLKTGAEKGGTTSLWSVNCVPFFVCKVNEIF